MKAMFMALLGLFGMGPLANTADPSTEHKLNQGDLDRIEAAKQKRLRKQEKRKG